MSAPEYVDVWPELEGAIVTLESGLADAPHTSIMRVVSPEIWWVAGKTRGGKLRVHFLGELTPASLRSIRILLSGATGWPLVISASAVRAEVSGLERELADRALATAHFLANNSLYGKTVHRTDLP